MAYDPQAVRHYFDNYGTQEWDRLEQTLQGRIKYAIHRRYLDEYVPDGAQVLDAGCGPGRAANTRTVAPLWPTWSRRDGLE